MSIKMISIKREAARLLFREAYDGIEDEKRRKVTKLHPDKFEDVIQVYVLNYLFNK
jgi:hypothetical protein